MKAQTEVMQLLQKLQAHTAEEDKPINLGKILARGKKRSEADFI
jgi:hypothetical protein